MSKFIQAKQGLDNTVIYQDESGKLYRFSNGTWSWRNHNPGNLRSKRKGSHLNQIGEAGNFAVFPDYDSGVTALIDCLKTEYKNKSIDNLVSKYAPPKENNVKLYRKFLQQKTGVSVKLKIKNYSEIEFIKVWKAIIVYEGYQTGIVDEIYTVNQVKKNYLGICEFFVETMGWISKGDYLSLAKTGLVNLVVCHSASGNEYLRARPNDPFQPDLSDIVIRELIHEDN